MDLQREKELLSGLADGVDPLTGEVLPEDHVCKYVTELVERGLIQTEHTSIIIQDGRKQNGSLLYTLLPIQFSIQQFYEQKLAKLDAECEQERIRKRLEASQQAQQETACPPA